MTFVRQCGGVLLLVGIAAACRSDRPAADAAPAAEAPAPATAAAAPTAPQLVHVIATDFQFDVPASIPAGAVSFHLMNQGKQFHHAMIVRLEDGKTMADMAKAMKTQGPPPPWLKFQGGPNGVAPGGTALATSLLTPGNYALICVIPGPDGLPHAAKGMVRGFTVSPAASSAPMPVATDTVRLKDYGFDSARPLTAGSHVILVNNTGPQPHELVVIKLMPGKSVKDFGEWATTGGMKGPPPGEPIGGVGVLDPGATSQFNADLTPGDYAYLCFVSDSKDGKPHLEHGMVTQFTVQ